MPKLFVSGTEYIGVTEAKVLTSLETANSEPAPIPLCQFHLTLRPNREVNLAQWALAPNGPARFKKVELQMLDRTNEVNKIWTMLKGYVSRYEEYEVLEDPNDPNVYDRIDLVITGILAANTQYNGSNILEVRAGDGSGNP